MPKEHPKMSQKVANMAPAWVQVGTMLRVRDRPGTTEADPSIDPANHTHFSGVSRPGTRAASQRPKLYPDIYRLELDCTYSCAGLSGIVTACWLRSNCRLDPRGSTQIIKSQPQNHCHNELNLTQHRHNTRPNINPKFHPKLIQNRPNINKKSSQNQLRRRLGPRGRF